jgi:hypothetical protein
MTPGKARVDATPPSRPEDRTSPVSRLRIGEVSRCRATTQPCAALSIDQHERQASSPAPLCDDTTSLRLDQHGQQAERVRNLLSAAGGYCIGFSWFLFVIVSAIKGDGEQSGDWVPFLVTAAAIIAGAVLHLAAWLAGRRTVGWWQPRLRAHASGASFDGLSVEPPQRPSPSHPANGLTDQYATAKRVRQELREARVYERRLDGGGTLLTEPILVLHRERRAGLAIFDQGGQSARFSHPRARPDIGTLRERWHLGGARHRAPIRAHDPHGCASTLAKAPAEQDRNVCNLLARRHPNRQHRAIGRGHRRGRPRRASR